MLIKTAMAKTLQWVMIMGLLSNFRQYIFQYKTDEKGVTAVEFSLIAIPFVYLLVGILEMCLMFGGGAILHGGTHDAARLIRTGQLQAEADPQAAFEQELCSHVRIFLNCDRLTYEVLDLEDAGGFGGASSTNPDINIDGEMVPRGFDPGEEDSVVLIRTAYRYPILTPLFADFLSDAPDNTKLFISTLVLKNEPYRFSEDF